MTTENDYYYKNQLKAAIDDCLNKDFYDDAEFGYVPPELVDNMVEAAWLILKHNKDANRYIKQNPPD